MSEDEMAADVWQKLEEIAAKKPEGFECVAFDIDGFIPTWVRVLEGRGYLTHSVQGGGGRYQVYNLSEKGKEAVAARKMSES